MDEAAEVEVGVGADAAGAGVGVASVMRTCLSHGSWACSAGGISCFSCL